MSIKYIKKIIIITTIIGLFLLWFVSTTIISLEHDHLVDTELKKLNQATQASAFHIGQKIDALHLFLKELAALVELNNDPYLIENHQIETFISTFIKNSEGKIDIFLIDETGDLYLFPLLSNRPVFNVSDREYYKAQHTPETKGFYISSPIFNRVTLTWNFAISYPLNIDNKTYVILITAKLEDFNNVIFKNFSDDHDITITYVREDGDILFRYPMERELLGTTVPDEIFKLFNQDKSGSTMVESNIFIKNKHLIMHDSVPEYPVKVVCDLDYSVMISKWIFRTMARVIINLITTIIFILLVRKMSIMVNELELSNNELKRTSRYDSLTGLVNRAYFYERFQEEIQRAFRYGTDLVLLTLDLDFFKKINDTYGHPEGDAVLSKLGKILKNNVRGTDIPARVGGEEFAIVMPETCTEEGSILANRLREEIHSITLKKGHVTASIGMSCLIKGDTTDSIFSRADAALYKAKSSGRDCIVIDDKKID